MNQVNTSQRARFFLFGFLPKVTRAFTHSQSHQTTKIISWLKTKYCFLFCCRKKTKKGIPFINDILDSAKSEGCVKLNVLLPYLQGLLENKWHQNIKTILRLNLKTIV